MQELYQVFQKAEKEAGAEIVEINAEEIVKFNNIIGDDQPIYDIIPPGYIMNITNRVIQRLFFKIIPLIVSEIKGFIHASSDVEFNKPIPLKNRYRIKIETQAPAEKKGITGNYYSFIFNTSILDETGEEIHAIDNHEFFFKL